MAMLARVKSTHAMKHSTGRFVSGVENEMVMWLEPGGPKVTAHGHLEKLESARGDRTTAPQKKFGRGRVRIKKAGA